MIHHGGCWFSHGTLDCRPLNTHSRQSFETRDEYLAPTTHLIQSTYCIRGTLQVDHWPEWFDISFVIFRKSVIRDSLRPKFAVLSSIANSRMYRPWITKSMALLQFRKKKIFSRLHALKDRRGTMSVKWNLYCLRAEQYYHSRIHVSQTKPGIDYVSRRILVSSNTVFGNAVLRLVPPTVAAAIQDILTDPATVSRPSSASRPGLRKLMTRTLHSEYLWRGFRNRTGRSPLMGKPNRRNSALKTRAVDPVFTRALEDYWVSGCRLHWYFRRHVGLHSRTRILSWS
jgi:hypothetical protein